MREPVCKANALYSKDPPPGCVNGCKNITTVKVPGGPLFTIFAESDCKMCSVAGGCYDGIVGRPDQCQTKSSTKIMTFYEGGNVVCSGGGDGNPVEASFSGTLGTPVSFDTYAWFQCFGGEG